MWRYKYFFCYYLCELGMVQQAEQSQPAIHAELRHERNIRAAHVQSHLAEQRRYLTPVMRLVIEHVCHQHPPWHRVRLAVDLARVGKLQTRIHPLVVLRH